MADTLELSWGLTLDIWFEVHKAEYYHQSQQVPGTCVRSYSLSYKDIAVGTY